MGDTRRTFLGIQAAGIATALVCPRVARAQKQYTPDSALSELLEGNKRFVAGQQVAFQDNLALLKKHVVQKQEPFAAVLSCADSRVPVEIVFDQSIGHVFVTRVAGNVITPEVTASLEYGAAILGTKVILVLGHADCGAVKATIEAEAAPGQISTLFARIQPAVDQAGSNLEAATKANAKIQSELLRRSSTVIAAMVRENKIKVAAGYYDLASGAVTLLDGPTSG